MWWLNFVRKFVCMNTKSKLTIPKLIEEANTSVLSSLNFNTKNFLELLTAKPSAHLSNKNFKNT
jgi:hypothetical protein